jgi:hypothetical protein
MDKKANSLQLFPRVPTFRRLPALAQEAHSIKDPTVAPGFVYEVTELRLAIGYIIQAELNAATRADFIGSRNATPSWKSQFITTNWATIPIYGVHGGTSDNT